MLNRFRLPIAIAVISLCFYGEALAESRCVLPDIDNEKERSLMYKSGYYVLENQAKLVYPYGSFSIFVDSKGTGHLQSHCRSSKKFPRKAPAKTKESVIVDWTIRTSFLKPKNGWTKLSIEEAEELWGKPRKHSIFDRTFFTFDARNMESSEPNIYHLDLSFGKTGLLNAYRVRGIGISNPQWVEKQD